MTIKNSVLNYDIDHIPVKNLSVVWVAAQRPYNQKWAKEIADNLDPDLFDPIVVTKPNGQGIYHIVEGQHRRHALEMYAAKCSPNGYGGNERAPCRVIEEANPARAAKIWLGINKGRKAIRPIVEFKVAVVAENEPELTISKIVRKAGYRIAQETSEGCIAAVAALKIVYNRHGEETLTNVLEMLKNMWGMNPHAVSNPMLRGFGMFLHEFGVHVNKTRMRKVAEKFDPWKFVEAAKVRKESTLEPLDEAIAELLMREYNKGLKDQESRLRHKS